MSPLHDDKQELLMISFEPLTNGAEGLAIGQVEHVIRLSSFERKSFKQQLLFDFNRGMCGTLDLWLSRHSGCFEW